MSWHFLLTTHDQDWTNVLILLIVLGIYISWSFFLSFLLSDSIRRIITTCAYNPCSIGIFFKATLTSDGLFWGLMDYFYICLKILLEVFFLLQKLIINDFVYWSRKLLFLIGNILNVYSYCFLIGESILLFFYCNNHVVVIFIECWYQTKLLLMRHIAYAVYEQLTTLY